MELSPEVGWLVGWWLWSSIPCVTSRCLTDYQCQNFKLEMSLGLAGRRFAGVGSVAVLYSLKDLPQVHLGGLGRGLMDRGCGVGRGDGIGFLWLHT